MKGNRIRIGAVVLAAFSLALILSDRRLEENPSIQKAPLPIEVIVERVAPEQMAVAKVDVEIPSTPLRRFVDHVVVESRILEGSSDFTRRRLLLKGDPAGGFPFVILEEILYYDEERLEWVAYSEIAARGDELIVDADPAKIDLAKLDTILETEELSIIDRSKLSDYVQVGIAEPTLDRYDAALALLKRSFPETIVEEDTIHFVSATPNDWHSANLWHLDYTRAADAWQYATGSSDIVVAVLDTGVNFNHPDLAANIYINPGEIAGNGIDDDLNGFVDDVRGYDFFGDDANADDDFGHGTHVSGILGAVGDNNVGVVGVNWSVKILPIRVGDKNGLASSDINEGLRYARNLKSKGVKVVATNNSYGSSSSNSATEAEIQFQKALGILFVAAAGNDGDNIDGPDAQYPAAYPAENIISVANSNQAGLLEPGSNYGATKVDLAAPGIDIYNTYLGSSYQSLTGTSMSSPMVAGAAALLASAEPQLDWQAIKRRILDSAIKTPGMAGKTLTGGYLDLLGMLKPNLAAHQIEVTSHPGSIVMIDKPGIPIEFALGALEGASVTTEVLDNGNSLAIVKIDDRRYRATPGTNGSARIRFTATLDGLARTVERFVQAGPVSTVSSGLLHSFDFNETSGAAIDSNSGANATLFGANRVNSPLGKALDVQATEAAGGNLRVDSYATFPMAFASKVTFSAFVKADDLDASAHPRIVDGENYSFYLSTLNLEGFPDGNKNTLKFLSERTPTVGAWNSPPQSVFAGDWMHLLAVYDSSSAANIPSLYINGQPQVVYSQGIGSGTQITTTGTAYIGDRDLKDRDWDGQFDELQIFNRLLERSDVGSLSARYMQARWNQYSLVRDEASDVGGNRDFVYKDSGGGSPSVNYRWSYSRNGGPWTALDETSNRLSHTPQSLSEYTYLLGVSDDWSTQYFSMSHTEPAIIEAGSFKGNLNGEGLVWFEVDPSKRSGFITLFELSNGLNLKRVPVSIDESGAFVANAGQASEVRGQIDDGFTGGVASLGISFSGSLTQPSSSNPLYTGEYFGQGMGLAGDEYEMLVTENGELFLWSEGSVEDAASLVVLSNGRFEGTTVRGAAVSGVIDGESGKVMANVVRDEVSNAAFLTKPGVSLINRYAALSSRGMVQPNHGVMIGGFIVKEPRTRRVLIRAAGPAMIGQNVPNVLDDPVIDVYSNGQLIASNQRWGSEGNEAELEALFVKTGAFAFDRGSKDAAMVLDLPPGSYGAIAHGPTGEEIGETLVEIYDEGGEVSSGLLGLSTRGHIGPGGALIGGLAIGGQDPKRVLLRVAGPAVLSQGLFETLSDPFLDLYSDGKVLVSNDDWDSPLNAVDQSAELAAVFTTLGLGAFEPGSKDAAILIWLNPGLYGVVATGSNDSEGIALVEVYEVP